jgi:predicted nucleic acid-binding Zn ribbon protein
VHKLLSAPAIQFKGTGWYVTDYGGKSGTKGDSAPAAPTKSDSAKTESTPAASSTESKPASDKSSSS